MNKSKYQVGDRLGQWRITKSYYSDWLSSWVYSLELADGRQKLTCDEKTLKTLNYHFK